MPVSIANRLQTTVYRSPKRLTLILIVFLVLVVGSQSTVVNSQSPTPTTPLEKARDDYTFQTSKHQEARDKYLAAKTNHMAFNTATSKNEAFLKTREYLVQTHNVFITYLLLIDERSNKYDWGKGPFKKDDAHKKIQDEVKSLENLRTEAENLKTLEETVTYAQKLKGHVESATLPIAYTMLSQTDLAQLFEAQFDFTDNANKIETYAKEKIAPKDNQLFLNWQSEVQSSKEEIKSKTEAKQTFFNSLNLNSRIDMGQAKFDFNTDKERAMFTPTINLLKEILTFI